MNWASASVDLFSPRKMLVESATMIYIITFTLVSFVILVWKGASLTAGQMMSAFFGLILTFSVAIRQFASFRS